jgi:hypothetical protein
VALFDAESNGEDDVIQIVQGTYLGARQDTDQGSLVYSSTEAFNLTIEGGYTSGCTSRVVDPANTVLDGDNTGTILDNKGTVLTLATNQSADFTVDGLTLQNGVALKEGNGNGGGLLVVTKGNLILTNNTFSANLAGDPEDGGNGGGAAVFDASSAILTNNVFSANSAGGASGDGNGGGLFTSDTSSVTLTNNTFITNSAGGGGGDGNGGGVFISNASLVTLTNNTFITNSATSSEADGKGGGVFIADTSSVTLTNNVFSANSAIRGASEDSVGIGGGVYVVAPMVILTNNTITANFASTKGGGLGLQLVDFSDSADIYNNIIWENSAAAGADLFLDNDGDGDLLRSTVNLFNNDFDQSVAGTFLALVFAIDPSNLDNEDPLFVDAANDDYHLQESSPVINAGNNGAPSLPDEDKDGNPRIVGNIVDMGAFESAVGGSVTDPTNPATLSVSPTSLDFGSVEAGSSKDSTFTVTNSGGGTLTGRVIATPPFRVVSGVSFSLGAGTSQAIIVRFSPTTSGSFAGTALVSSDGGSANVSLTGTGTTVGSPDLQAGCEGVFEAERQECLQAGGDIGECIRQALAAQSECQSSL